MVLHFTQLNPVSPNGPSLLLLLGVIVVLFRSESCRYRFLKLSTQCNNILVNTKHLVSMYMENSVLMFPKILIPTPSNVHAHVHVFLVWSVLC